MQPECSQLWDLLLRPAQSVDRSDVTTENAFRRCSFQLKAEEDRRFDPALASH
jgi:hypothetical protein